MQSKVLVMIFNKQNESLFKFYFFTRVRKNINLCKNPWFGYN